MKKKTVTGLIVLIVLICVVIAFSVFSIITPQRKLLVKITRNNYSSAISGSDISSDYDEKAAKEYKKDYIAALYIEGTIQEANVDYNQEWLISTIKNLKNDNRNVALAVYINSPGGAVYQADEAYLALQDYKTSGKPVYIYQGPMAASGGYYISCAGNKIYANRNTLTGCIGVITGTCFDLTELFENLGIKSETIHSGRNKNMMNYNEPFSDEQKEIMQSISDECYDQFISIVSRGRHLSVEDAYALSDGRLYTAKQALENGLIDKIDTWEGMLRDLSEEELKKPGIEVRTYRKEKKQSFVDMLMGKAKELQNAKAAATLGVPESLIEDMNNRSLEPMYLYKN